MSESGKTTLAKRLAAYHKDSGNRVIVLTSVWDNWKCDFLTDNPEKFLEVFWKNESVYAFMDEGGDTVGRYSKAMTQTATRGRHWGHSCYYIIQDATLIDPVIRRQCSQTFVFNCAPSSAKALMSEFNRAEILDIAPRLEQGRYIRVQRFGKGGKPGEIVEGNAFA